ncbi:MGMT family [Cordyceps militaris]|uniref:MGMT family n=1 Tax=Cordyceps militaris TaxID=73501 RepID=A0A2H4SAC9_CORMI|nr:MGMT family [Cordyceps militaris]
MPQTDEAAAFFHAVYSAISQIPRGHVTTYGHIAQLIGTPQRPRQVGVCLKHLPEDASARWNHANVPWQRVVNARGVISPRGRPAAVRTQAQLLQEEGVEVGAGGGLGELRVDLADYGWFPSVLPEEEEGVGVQGAQDTQIKEEDSD